MYGFTVQNPKIRALEIVINLTHLGQKTTFREDSFVYDEQRKIACVADGVTRDFLDGSVVSHDLNGMMKFLNEEYPNPSPAREAADICTKTFLETMSLNEANKRIWYYNLKNNLTETDYLAKDLAGCTAAGFLEDNGIINYSFIADSRIAIINNKRNLRFKTPDEGPHSEGKRLYLESRVQENGGWNNSQARIDIRRDYRNNPNNNYFSFGVLTGEKNAERYIETGMQPIRLGDYVLAFTDGITDIAFNRKNGIEVLNQDFYNVLNQDNPSALKRFCQKRVHAEGTLVVYKVE